MRFKHTDNIIKCLFILCVYYVRETVSDKTLRQRQPERNGGGNSALDYAEYPQNEQDTLQQQQQQAAAAAQIMAESKRRKGQMNTDNVEAETQKLNETYSMVADWPVKTRIGCVAAVTFDTAGNVVIFHRSDRIWKSSTFKFDNTYTEQNLGPIRDNTVIAFDRRTGKTVYEWGKNLFYMPHGLSIDHEHNFWVTDVALHQVMKFPSSNNVIDQNPLLVLGKSFKPGNTADTFCKPTSVAVLPTGEFFVADGYCNARIIKFSKAGTRILSWGENSFQGKSISIAPPNYFAVPHGLTLALDKGLICVADRENGRVQCFKTENGEFHSQYHSPIVGDRLFSVSYAPIDGGQLFVVNGPVAASFHQVKGFVIDMETGAIISKFGPNKGNFANPHDIVVSSDGIEVYVAELDPNRVYKFILGNATTVTGNDTKSESTPSLTQKTPSGYDNSSRTTSINTEKSATALLVVSLFCIVTVAIFASAVIISKRRKRADAS